MAALQLQRGRQRGRLALLAFAIYQNMVHAQSLSLLDKPAMRLYGIFSTVEGPWGLPGQPNTENGDGDRSGDSTVWTDEDVAAASPLEMIFPVR